MTRVIDWAAWPREGERQILHISMELNHRFVDGLHVGLFHQALSELMEAL